MQRLLVGLCLCFALFGVFGQVDANEHTSVDEKIEDFLRRKGLEMGIDAKKGRIITKGKGETKAEAMCKALGEMAMLVRQDSTSDSSISELSDGQQIKKVQSKESASETIEEVQSKASASETLIEGLEVQIRRESQRRTQRENQSKALIAKSRSWVETTKIKFADDNNHERGMMMFCDYKSRSKSLVKESGEIMRERDTETRSDVQIVGSLNGILDTLKEKRLFSIWFASDDLRELAVLMIFDRV